VFSVLGARRGTLAFSGFANDTPWFLFGALLLGMITTRSGIARRPAYFIMLHIGVTYPRIRLGLILTDFLLTFIVPSGIARVVIMAASCSPINRASSSSAILRLLRSARSRAHGRLAHGRRIPLIGLQ
jgi:di/tricarboxylate transporter